MQQKPILLTILDILSIIAIGIATYFALVLAPTELVMGEVQRVFYFHVGTGWVALLGFIIASIAGVAYLVSKKMFWDRFGLAAVEVSAMFFLITIVLGSIWARPAWNTWWTWDVRLTSAAVTELIFIAYFMLRAGIEDPETRPAWNTWWTWDVRLTSAAVTELIFIAYFMLRAGIEDPEKRARFGAIYTLLGGLSAPITFMVIRLFRSIHPVVVGNPSAEAQGGFDMTVDMRNTLFITLIAFTILFIDFIWHRVRLGGLQEKVEQLKLKTLGE